MKEEKELKIVVTEGVKEITVRHGDALPLHEISGLLELKGTIRAPGDFLNVRREQCPVKQSYVSVSEDRGEIMLVTNDQSDIGMVIVTGKITIHPDFLRIGVNNPKIVRQPTDLAAFIKMNRTMFESKDVANNLVSALRNLKAKVNKTIEESGDDRANYSKLREQVVESNIPDTFKLHVPLFVGCQEVVFPVEIVIDPEDFGCALISPEAADMAKIEKGLMIAEQVERFEGYVVIYE